MKRLAVAMMLVLASLGVQPAAGQAQRLQPSAALTAAPGAPRPPGPLLPDEVRAAQPAAPQNVSGPIYARTYGGFEFRTTTTDQTYQSAGNAIYATTYVPSKSFRLPMVLPDGAQVITVTFFFVDDDPVGDENLAVISYTPAITIATNITSTTTAGLPITTTIQSLSFAGSPLFTVDNAHAGYALRFAPILTTSVALQLAGAQVQYTLPVSFLPLAQR